MSCIRVRARVGLAAILLAATLTGASVRVVPDLVVSCRAGNAGSMRSRISTSVGFTAIVLTGRTALQSAVVQHLMETGATDDSGTRIGLATGILAVYAAAESVVIRHSFLGRRITSDDSTMRSCVAARVGLATLRLALITACQRLISRHLVSPRSTTDAIVISVRV